MEETALTFPSKVDPWFIGVVIATIILPTVILVRLPMRGATVIVPLAVLLVSAGLPLRLLATTRYTLTSDTLQVRSGPVRVNVPLKSVTAVRASRTVLSAPALSLDRIEVS